MTGFGALLSQIGADLNGLGAAWCLIGGLAVGARCDPRFTKDLDLAVACTDDVASEALVFSLVSRGYRVIAILEQKATGRLATARLTPPHWTEPVIVDLLFASCGVESEVVAAAEVITVLPGVEVPVASLGDLVALKVLSRNDDSRPQDKLDLKALLAQCTSADLARAQHTLDRIQSAGAHRKRALDQELKKALAELR